MKGYKTHKNNTPSKVISVRHGYIFYITDKWFSTSFACWVSTSIHRQSTQNCTCVWCPLLFGKSKDSGAISWSEHLRDGWARLDSYHSYQQLQWTKSTGRPRKKGGGACVLTQAQIGELRAPPTLQGPLRADLQDAVQGVDPFLHVALCFRC